jgi:hypothetical protein
MACYPLREFRERVYGHAVAQQIEIALSPHARPQALDEASYALRLDHRKGLAAVHTGRLHENRAILSNQWFATECVAFGDWQIRQNDRWEIIDFYEGLRDSARIV